MSLLLFGILALCFLAAIYVLVQYNGLVALRNHIGESWSDIDTELKRRHDLIPNLVETVRGYARHEHDVLEMVVKIRSECMAPHTGPLRGRLRMNPASLRPLGRLVAVAVSYLE